MVSIVASTRIRRNFKHEVFMKVKKSMELSKWYNNVDISNNKVIILVDLKSKYVVPGICTSPWVFESVLNVIRAKFPKKEFFLGLLNHSKKAESTWKYSELIKQLSIKSIIINKKNAKLDESLIIGVPVLRTNSIYKLQGANVMQSELNEFSKKEIDFFVADATVCFKGQNNLFGRPFISSTIISSSDRSSLDSALCEMVGFSNKKVYHKKDNKIQSLKKEEYKLIGDLPKYIFPKPGKTSFSFLDNMRTRRWFNRKGNKHAKNIVKHSELYEQEFGKLIKW